MVGARQGGADLRNGTTFRACAPVAAVVGCVRTVLSWRVTRSLAAGAVRGADQRAGACQVRQPGPGRGEADIQQDVVADEHPLSKPAAPSPGQGLAWPPREPEVCR